VADWGCRFWVISRHALWGFQLLSGYQSDPIPLEAEDKQVWESVTADYACGSINPTTRRNPSRVKTKFTKQIKVICIVQSRDQ
jgi:hypothetical protein